jgi:hypothetical protein
MNYENGIGIGQQAGFGSMVNQQTAIAPKAPDGVTSLTDQAHQAFEILSRELGELHAHLQPLIEPWPESCEQRAQGIGCEASAVTGLRILIEKIADKTTYIRQLNSALRV